MVTISAASGGYALLTAIALWVRGLVTKAWVFFVSDQVIKFSLPLLFSRNCDSGSW